MTILVTGGAGFIGSRVVQALNAEGAADIVVVDSLSPQKERNLAGRQITDLIDKQELARRLDSGALPRLEAVLHQGACTDTRCQDHAYLEENNVRLSAALLDLALGQRIPFVYASSLSVHGVAPSPYARSKRAFDEHVQRVLPSAESTVVGLRYGNVYGAGERHKGPMASMAYRAYRQAVDSSVVQLFGASHGFGPGEHRRDFVFVDDVARVVLAALNGRRRAGIADVGTGRARTFNELAECVIREVGHGRVGYVPMPPDVAATYHRASQASVEGLRALGLPCRFHRLEEGVAAAVAGWRAEDAAEGGGDHGPLRRPGAAGADTVAT